MDQCCNWGKGCILTTMSVRGSFVWEKSLVPKSLRHHHIPCTAKKFLILAGHRSCSGPGLYDCLSCSPGWALNGTCVPCVPGQFYDPGSRKCYECFKDCWTCSGPSSTDCKSCRNPYLVIFSKKYGPIPASFSLIFVLFLLQFQ